MASATDQGAIEGALDSASDGSVNKSRNDAWYKRWIREDIHFQNLNLNPVELHYLCQETNLPTLGVTWNYPELVYSNSFIREQPKQYVSFFVTIPEEKPVVSEYASCILLDR